MQILKILMLVLVVGCTTTKPQGLQSNFVFSKAYVELSYISRDKTELQQLLTIVESNATPQKKFNEWDSKFDDKVKVEVLKKYIKEGHRGL
jgi:hypothetical protein